MVVPFRYDCNESRVEVLHDIVYGNRLIVYSGLFVVLVVVLIIVSVNPPFVS